MPEYTYGCVTARDEDYVVVAGRVDVDDPEWVDEVLLFGISGEWRFMPVPGTVVAMTFIDEGDPALIALSGDGAARVISEHDVTVEVVDPSVSGPSSLQWLLGMKLIGSRVYTCGMLRQVYVRNPDGRWQRTDDGLRTDDVAGLKAIDGFDENEIYTVGFRGELWSFDGRVWTPQESPTNVKLECVHCSTDGLVYAAGAMGTIIRGRAGRWERVHQSVTEATVWDVAQFGESIFFATKAGLYEIVSGELQQVDLGLLGTVSTGRLCAAGNALWSVGHRDIIRLREGNWEFAKGPAQDKPVRES